MFFAFREINPYWEASPGHLTRRSVGAHRNISMVAGSVVGSAELQIKAVLNSH